MKQKLILLTFIFSLVNFSCSDEESFETKIIEKDPYSMSGVFENDSKERLRNTTLELTKLLQNIISNKDANEEIFYLLKNKYYADNVFKLSDILFYENSEAYKSSKINPNIKGSFKKAFNEEINKTPNQYLNLNYLVNSNTENLRVNQSNANFYDTAELTIYYPYDVNDNDTPFSLEENLTLVPAVIDTNEGIGYRYSKEDDSWSNEMTNDDYANIHKTYIIQAERNVPYIV